MEFCVGYEGGSEFQSGCKCVKQIKQYELLCDITDKINKGIALPSEQ